jgi:hypothetical protein
MEIQIHLHLQLAGYWTNRDNCDEPEYNMASMVTALLKRIVSDLV